MLWLHDRLQSIVTVHAHTLGRTGTGFVVSADGHLLTAAHCVVDDLDVPTGDPHTTETDITVVFRRGDTARAVLVGFDMHADVAVLSFASGSSVLPPIPVRRHTYPHPGDTCVVVGNLFGQDPYSVAVGAVRNGRWHDPHGRSLLSTVLTDVAAGAGTSGGPILDTMGHVVALHTAAYGALPHVCVTCGEAFRSTDDLQCHATRTGHAVGRSDDHRASVSGTTSAQLGGGVAAPLLWRIYCAILEQGPVVPRSVLPCTAIPCAPGNVWRIRAALGDSGWVQPPTAGWCVVRSGGGLQAGDVVVGSVPLAVHDPIWLLLPGHACTLNVVRQQPGSTWGQLPPCVVETLALPMTRDVAHGQTHVVTDDDGWYNCGSPDRQFCHRFERLSTEDSVFTTAFARTRGDWAADTIVTGGKDAYADVDREKVRWTAPAYQQFSVVCRASVPDSDWTYCWVHYTVERVARVVCNKRDPEHVVRALLRPVWKDLSFHTWDELIDDTSLTRTVVCRGDNTITLMPAIKPSAVVRAKSSIVGRSITIDVML